MAGVVAEGLRSEVPAIQGLWLLPGTPAGGGGPHAFMATTPVSLSGSQPRGHHQLQSCCRPGPLPRNSVLRSLHCSGHGSECGWKLQQEKRLQHLAEVSAEVRQRQAGTQQELEQLYQELGTLKQQAGQERDKLQRHQTFLQLLNTLQGKLQFPETEAELPHHSDLLKDNPQQLTQPQEQTTGDTIGRHEGVSSKADGLLPTAIASLS